MPLPNPVLDDRSYQQLRDELVRRIPVYNPEWTDRSVSDPGITLLELFAFLGENLLFRFNQIPETTHLAFLQLLDVPLRPAVPARTLVAFEPKTDATELVELGTELRAGDIPFETLTEARVLPVSLVAVARAAEALPDDDEIRDFAALAIDALDLQDDEEPVFYSSRLLPEDPAAPDARAVDFGEAVDGVLWVAALAKEKDDSVKEAALGAVRDHVLNVGFVPDDVIEDGDEVEVCSPEGRRGPPLSWQISTGQLDTRTGEPIYRTLAVAGDTTRGLTRPGVVRLQLPKDASFRDFPAPGPGLAGAGDRPPELEDDELAERVVFWLRAFRDDGSRLGRILWVGANAVEVEQATRALPEFLGTGTGDADQRYALVHRPVLERTLVVEVDEPGGWKPWRAVDGFHASREDDRHFVLDQEGGEVRFGDGVRGRAPQIGERIRATTYRHGGGRRGNVAAGAISKVQSGAAVKAANPLPARGGADGESVAEALERVPGELRRRDRAVTADDFRELARATPGADVARAESLARFHPRTRTVEAAGVVTVVVWPREDRRRPNAPTPDRTLLRAVCRWLDARRLVTTELYVVPPRYRRIAVAVGLSVKPGYGVEAVRRWVELVLRQYLSPLPPFGPEGAGWPLGRRVHGPELEAAALQVEGVEFLDDLRVAGLAADGRTWVEGSVELERDEVPELAEITVVEGPARAPGDALGPPPPERTPVPILIPREEC